MLMVVDMEIVYGILDRRKLIFGALGMWLGSYDNWFLNIISFLLYGMAGLSAIQLFRMNF